MQSTVTNTCALVALCFSAICLITGSSSRQGSSALFMRSGRAGFPRGKYASKTIPKYIKN